VTQPVEQSSPSLECREAASVDGQRHPSHRPGPLLARPAVVRRRRSHPFITTLKMRCTRSIRQYLHEKITQIPQN
jgi:hypothetical protein